MFTVQIAGHLGKKPETRFTPSGQKVTNFSIATNHRKGKEDITQWVRVVIWGDRFDKLLAYLDKGSAIIVTGRMNPPSSYTDKEGRLQITLEVTAEMIDFSPFGKGRTGEQQNEGSHDAAPSSSASSASSFSSQQPQYEKQSPYAGQTSGMGNHFADVKDEDDLPF
jgi:single-strand DNA-binding protein